MIIKLMCIIGILLLPVFGFSQKKGQAQCSPGFPLIQNDSVYIKGQLGKRIISRSFFKRKFELAVSDKSFKVVGFYIIWNDMQAKIYTRGNKGAKVYPGIQAGKSEKEKYSLKKIDPGVILAFDCIILKKGNEYFKSPPLVYEISF